MARDLKYHTPNTDLDSLQRELGGSGYLGPTPGRNGSASAAADSTDPDDPGSVDDWVAPTR